ncbi:MAG: F0F1 ATP synthase subunit C [Holosporales bacterium]|jgi:F-type H+-transporting ATPase subunit c|nr:F0F1 ATP synthase subunit C [Holosporales bacterium]
MDPESARYFSAGMTVLGLCAVGLSLGLIFSTWLKAVGRNPSAKEQLNSVGILAFAMTEAIALFSLLIAFLILFR